MIQGECYIMPCWHDSNVYVFLSRSGDYYTFMNKETEEGVGFYTRYPIVFFKASPVIVELYETSNR